VFCVASLLRRDVINRFTLCVAATTTETIISPPHNSLTKQASLMYKRIIGKKRGNDQQVSPKRKRGKAQ